MMRALVVGGTGPTGPFLVQGLLRRGYHVTMLHRGTHEVPEIPPEVEHLHVDPHFRQTLEAAFVGRTFDLAIATYGRLRLVAEALWGKTPRFIGIGGIPVYRGALEPAVNFPVGMRIPTPETAPVVQNDAEGVFAHKIAQTEAAVMHGHLLGKFAATFFRYPLVYGPYQVAPPEWSIIRRILDKRPYLMLPDGGLTLVTRGYAANLAQAVLLAVDQPEVAAGQIYNCGDEQLLSLYQWVQLIAQTLEYRGDIVCLPGSIVRRAQPLIPMATTWHHWVVDLSKITMELHYRDVLPVTEALPRTVQWYVDHQPGRGGEIEKNLHDPFNYAAEDQLVGIFQACVQQLEAIPCGNGSMYHPYAHPKHPGQRDHRNR
jgi:nucleoside-diphosphate-sugar epimerase